MPWHWQPLAYRGTIVTESPNLSTKTSSSGLRQCCLCLVWADSSGGVSSTVLTHLSIFVYFILALHHHCTPLAPPLLIIDGRHGLAILPLPCHFCGDTIVASPLPCLCWSGTIVPWPLPRRHYCGICTAAATICLSPCHCRQRMSLSPDESPPAVLANADANVVVVSPCLWQHWHWHHCCMSLILCLDI